VEDLVRFQASLACALSEAGISGSQLNQIFSTRLRAECAECGIQITGDEIVHVAVAEEATELPHPKLKRLRLGYCAREGCESYDYRIHLEDHPGVDWTTVTEKAHQLELAAKAAASEEEKRRARQKQNQRTKRVVAGLSVVIALLLVSFLTRHGRLPFTKKPHKYEIDPASVRQPPSR
jgi:hypothetical protein